MDDTTPPPLAQRTCLQCKESKKRCDKLIPKCSRCSRLTTDCTYNEPERPNGQEIIAEPSDARFDEVFQRLQKLEAQVFRTHDVSRPIPLAEDMVVETQNQSQASDTVNSFTINPENWAVHPGHLRPRHMRMILFGSLMSALKAHNTTVHVVSAQYFARTHQWLPIIWQDKFERQVVAFNGIDETDRFLLQILAMQLLVTPLDIGRLSTPEECPWYRACKHHFAQFVALGEPSIEIVQMGMLVALHEYLQDIGERALTTLGFCVRIAYDIGLDDVVARQAECSPGEMRPLDEEAVLTWWGLSRLERYFNMPPNPFPKQPSMPLQEYAAGVINGNLRFGPPISNYSIIDEKALDYSVAEFEAARRLGRVQAYLREHRRNPTPPRAEFDTLMRELQEYTLMLRMRMRTTHSGAGMAVNLGATLQLQIFFSEKHDSMDNDTLRLMHSIVTQIRDVIGHCRLMSGFTKNYMEGKPPTWFTLPLVLLVAARKIKTLDSENQLPNIDFSPCYELLKIMAPRYKLAGKCLHILQNSPS
ncbi:hypothetical protein CC80DRAFT_547934 [Byssothecium circinans]|uniref:Zn(2)-C6 fungal-type domain-containing protein n=1 Tax=Byssothecium circinans TaxID=147558 RepID=A0A6A5U2K3_9PLEO|nr:hypothetical protein CC80DRAFT_547934 [Byssothecium circinans]